MYRYITYVMYNVYLYVYIYYMYKSLDTHLDA